MKQDSDWRLSDAWRALCGVASNGFVVLTKQQAETLEQYVNHLSQEESATEEMVKLQMMTDDLLAELCSETAPDYEIVIRRARPTPPRLAAAAESRHSAEKNGHQSASDADSAGSESAGNR